MEMIEAATMEDSPALADLLAVLFAQEAEFQPDRARQERGLRLLLGSPALGTIFAARDGAEVAGMASLLFTVSTAEGGPACWLEDVVVRPIGGDAGSVPGCSGTPSTTPGTTVSCGSRCSPTRRTRPPSASIAGTASAPPP